MAFDIPFPAQPRFPILAPDGSASAPSYSFRGYPTKGFFSYTAETVGLAVSGSMDFMFYSNGFDVLQDTAQIRLGRSQDTVLARDASNVLAMRNGVSAQTFNLYNTYTDASNYERGRFEWASNVLTIGTQKLGTGTQRQMVLSAARVTVGNDTTGINYWYFDVDNTGALRASMDNAYDLGQSGASRPRTGYFGTSVVTPLLTSTGLVHAYSATAIPAGGAAGAGFRFSSASNFGVFFGSGAPTLSAGKGSLYLRSDGSGTGDRAYINTDGSTTWTALTTAA